MDYRAELTLRLADRLFVAMLAARGEVNERELKTLVQYVFGAASIYAEERAEDRYK